MPARFLFVGTSQEVCGRFQKSVHMQVELPENTATCFCMLFFKLNDVEAFIKKPASVTQDSIPIDQVMVYSATLWLFHHIFLNNSKLRRLASFAATSSS